MLRTKTNSLVHLEHYLQTRPRHSLPPSKRRNFAIASTTCLVGAGLALSDLHTGAGLAGFFLASSAFLGFRSFKSPPQPQPDADTALLIRADAAAANLADLMRTHRLKSSLHPGVGAILNECAGFWRRIVSADQQKVWSEADRSSLWLNTRDQWRLACDLAMSEALLLAETSVTYRAPKSNAERVIETVLDNFSIKLNGESEEPLPPEFADLRSLAENLRDLAKEVESATEALKKDPIESSSPASHRLEEALGHLRAIRQAEEELEQRTRF